LAFTVIANFEASDATCVSLKLTQIEGPLKSIDKFLKDDQLDSFLRDETGKLTDEGEMLRAQWSTHQAKLEAIKDVVTVLQSKESIDCQACSF
jgi:hypothetical protein